MKNLKLLSTMGNCKWTINMNSYNGFRASNGFRERISIVPKNYKYFVTVVTETFEGNEINTFKRAYKNINDVIKDFDNPGYTLY